MVDGTLYQLLLLFLLFYFFLIRPEMKKAKKHQEMLDNLKNGDKIITRGGICGTIVKIDNENELTVQIANGVTIVLNKLGVLSLATEMPQPKTETLSKNKKTKK